MSEELMTGKELREHLKVSRATVRRLVKAGKLTARHIGPKVVRFSRADVDRLVVEAGRPISPKLDTRAHA